MLSNIKLPFWLGMMLGMLFGMLVMLIVTAPQTSPPVVEYKAANQQTNIATLPAEQLVKADASSVETMRSEAVVSKVNDQASIPNIALEPVYASVDPVDALTPPVEAVTTNTPQEVAVPLALKAGHGIALVLDDVGYNLGAVKRILNLSVPVAMSILPETPFARQAAILTKQAGQVVMLHLPMQPTDSSLKTTSAFLRDNMAEQDIRDTFLRDLEKVPYVEGVNNHMGSKLTQLDAPMHWVMQVCQEKGLFFVDSRTSANSVAAKAAEKAGIAWASRSIFLDHEMTTEAMQQAWQRARNCAKKKLSCIVIAHPRSKTVAFLENHLSKEDAANMVSIKHLLQSTPVSAQVSKAELP